MDGVQWLKEFAQHQEQMSRLLYYPDPEFMTFGEVEKIVEDQTAMEIKGNHLDLLRSTTNFQIKLGEKESCKIKSVSTDLLVCDLPPTFKNSSAIGTNISVEVFMGSTSQHLGYIEIMPMEQNHMSWGLLVICVLTLFSIIGVTFLCFRKLRRKKPFLNFSNTNSNRHMVPHDYNLVNTRDSPPEISQSQLRCISSISDETTATTALAETVATTDAIAPRDATAITTTDATAVRSTATANATADASDNVKEIATEKRTIDTTANADSSFNMLEFLDRKKITLLEEKGLIIQKTELTVEGFLGSGHFGQVFKGTLQRSNEEKEVAIKTLHRHVWSNPIEAENFMGEALKMKDFDHPHVLGLLGVYFEGGRMPIIVLPFMENGDVSKYITEDFDLKVSDLVKLSVDVASGMCYLSDLNFVHRDLATRNCVLDSCMVAKVADFGMSRNMYGSDYYRTKNTAAEVPFRWMAPEAIEPGIYTTKSDVWSYGVLLWELMTRGGTPYADITNWDVLPYLKAGNRLNIPKKCPEALYMGMVACWNTDPSTRPTFLQLHSYVSEIHKRLLSCTKANTAISSATVEPNTPTVDHSSSDDVAENPGYCNCSVPTLNTNYYNSKELYLQMDGKCLSKDALEQRPKIVPRAEWY